MKRIMKVIPIVLMLMALCTISNKASAAVVVSEEKINGVQHYVIGPSSEDDYTVIMRCLRTNGNNGTVITLQPGTYKIDRVLHVFDNTQINASGATITQKTPGKGLLINARYLNSYYGNGVGKYNNCKNITVDGGTWIGTNKPDKSKTKKSNGFYVGYSSFLFTHGQNITIKNANFKHNYNGHFVEFAGVKNGSVLNCNMNMKGSKYVGESSNEAIQIDNTYAKANSPGGKPWDDTTCKNIVIDNCNIKYARGIGTNRIGKKFFENITITNSKITATQGEGINAYDIKGLVVKNNIIKVTHKKDDYRSTGLYLGLDSKITNWGKYTTVIEKNTITGYNAGLKVVAFHGAKFGKITLKNNTFQSKKNKDSALVLAYKGKQIQKLVKKDNKLKKA